MSQDHANVAFFPPLGAAVTVILILVLSTLFPLDGHDGLPPRTLLAIGCMFFAFGTGLGLWAVVSFIKAGTHVEPHKPTLSIVTDGPYRLNRNPMYTALICAVSGLSIVAFDLWWTLMLVPVFALALHFGVVLREEAYLLSKFGGDYQALLDRTRRWL